MSKIYDALENRNAGPDNAGVPSSQVWARQLNGDHNGIEAEMNALYRTITASLPDKPYRSVLFVGAQSKGGTSTISKELAKTVSKGLGKKVLFVDCEGNCDEFAHPDIDPSVRLEDILENKAPISKAISPVDGGSLSILPFYIWAGSPRVQTLHNEHGRLFWNAVSAQFDLVVIDYSQEMLANGPVITPMVDGVVLVVEAEKTRWQVALNIKEKISRNGGNILGLAYNKRRLYIPQFIYDRL